MPNVPFTVAGAEGPFSTLENNIRATLRAIGESSPDTVISLMGPRLIACANIVVDEVNRHPQFVDMLDTDKQFDPVPNCVTVADSPLVTVPTAPSQLNLYAPVRLSKGGYGGGPLISFVTEIKANNQYRLADAAHTDASDAELRPLYTSRLRRFVTNADIRYIDDQVMIEGIKYYWSIDESSVISPSSMQKLSGRYYQTLNAWMSSLANYQGVLENDNRQDRFDY